MLKYAGILSCPKGVYYFLTFFLLAIFLVVKTYTARLVTDQRLNDQVNMSLLYPFNLTLHCNIVLLTLLFVNFQITTIYCIEIFNDCLKKVKNNTKTNRIVRNVQMLLILQ